LITNNYKGVNTTDQLRANYENNLRTSTIQMTGPTAAEKSSGYGKEHKKAVDRSFEIGNDDLAGASEYRRRKSLFMRDNWWFQMYLVKDQYFHDWIIK
jgi:hypothetical protein